MGAFPARAALRFARNELLPKRYFPTLLFNGLVRGDFAVADMDDAVRVLGDIVLVSHQNDGVALGMEVREQRHDFVTGL